MRRNTESLSLDRLTVAELKKQLTAKGISDLSGRKADLIARLTKDGSDDDDKIAPSPVETPVKTPVKSGGKGAGLGRQLRAASWLLNLVIATAICIGCIYVGGNSVLVSRQDSIDNINFLKLQAQEDEAIIENMGNEKIELLAKLKEVRQQYDYLEEIYERLRDKSKKASQKEGTNYETDFESRDDTQKAKEGSEWDDKDDRCALSLCDYSLITTCYDYDDYANRAVSPSPLQPYTHLHFTPSPSYTISL